MTTTVRHAILSKDEEYDDFYNITNSQRRLETGRLFSYTDEDGNAGLLVRAMEHYDSENYLASVVRRFDIERLGTIWDYFDDGLFRVNFLRLLRGQDADGWKVTRVRVEYGRLMFCLHNPSLAALANGQRELLTGFRRQALDLRGEKMNKDDRLIAGLGTPNYTVMAYWQQPEFIEGTEPPELAGPKELAYRTSFYFDVWAPKPSGKYPKNRRTGIYLAEDSSTTVVEYSKHYRREIEFLKPTPEQVNTEEQPVIITEYHE